ncbi:DUF3742 family protein [Pseudomonas alliivorans]|nr:DUF3742 family protein [Pseudomonas alliivorans]MEE5167987.1 DUF3742 family protein [Pseudomonas alliivorans]
MTINAQKNGGVAMRIGHILGRGVGKMLRSERSLWAAFERTGAPNLLIAPVKWFARAAAIAAAFILAAWGLVYAAGIFAVAAIAFGLVSGGAGDRTRSGVLQSKSSQTELQDGLEGYGLYVDGVRID